MPSLVPACTPVRFQRSTLKCQHWTGKWSTLLWCMHSVENMWTNRVARWRGVLPQCFYLLFHLYLSCDVQGMHARLQHWTAVHMEGSHTNTLTYVFYLLPAELLSLAQRQFDVDFCWYLFTFTCQILPANFIRCIGLYQLFITSVVCKPHPQSPKFIINND